MFVCQLLIAAGFILTAFTALNVKRFQPSTDAF
jgi:hypothetical protein